MHLPDNYDQVIKIRDIKLACSTCSVRELCLPVGLGTEEMNQLDKIISHRRRFRRGDSIYEGGQAFQSLYAVHSGCCKTILLDNEGHEQVTGFYISGELLGMDGISTSTHCCDAIALEDTELCEIPFGHLEKLSTDIPSLMRRLYTVLSSEITREHEVMRLLASMKAEQRVAAFLLNLSERYAARGFSPVRFHLRMTREEIGSYLGLKLETVSRMFSKLRDAGIIHIASRYVEIKDKHALKQCLGNCAGTHSSSK